MNFAKRNSCGVKDPYLRDVREVTNFHDFLCAALRCVAVIH
jgi:hypothetical protein